MLINPLITSNQAWSGGLTSGAPAAGADKNLTACSGVLRCVLRGALEEFVDQSLIGLGLLGGEAAQHGSEDPPLQERAGLKPSPYKGRGEAAKLGEEIPTCFT